MVFGYKSSGKEAESSLNKFYYLTYEDNADLSLSEDENRMSSESQMAFFGKTPSQLFQKPHPQKYYRKEMPLNFNRLSRMKILKEET